MAESRNSKRRKRISRKKFLARARTNTRGSKRYKKAARRYFRASPGLAPHPKPVMPKTASTERRKSHEQAGHSTITSIDVRHVRRDGSTAAHILVYGEIEGVMRRLCKVINLGPGRAEGKIALTQTFFDDGFLERTIREIDAAGWHNVDIPYAEVKAAAQDG